MLLGLLASLAASSALGAEAAPVQATSAPVEKKGEAAPKSDAAKVAEKEPAAEGERLKPVSLSEKIRPVSGNLFLKSHRLEISPGLNVSLGDAFFQKYGAGLKLGYHFSESFSLGAYASYSLDTPSSSLSWCSTSTDCQRPTLDQLEDVPGRIGFMAGLEVAWSPLYGKINVLAEKVLHFDTSLILGGGAIQHQIPGGTFTVGPAGHVGIGQRYFFSRYTSLRVELRDYIYSAEIGNLGTDRQIQNQLMLEVGLSFFAGEAPKE
jgi:outer membrane beta-barrel protein